MTSVEVTVVVPTRNRSDLLAAALQTALRQQEVAHEVLVVDDGSTDGTFALAAGWGDDRVRAVRQDHRGATAARNTGIAEARGSWIAFLDDDDVWSPRKLRTQLDAASAAGAEWVYSDAVGIDADGAAIEYYAGATPDRLRQELFDWCAVPAGNSNVVARRGLLERHRGFDERLPIIGDWDLWLRLSADARAAACAEPLVGYRMHQDNMHMVAPHRELMRELELMIRKHGAAADGHGLAFDPRDVYLHWRRTSQERAGRRFRAARSYAVAARRQRSPAMAARALVATLGEGAMRGARQLRTRTRLPEQARPDSPQWLDDLRR